MDAGTNRIRSSDRDSRTSSALLRWPQWIGSKVPPNSPILMGLGKMEWWSIGVMEYWVLNSPLHYSNTPSLQYSNLSSFPDLPIAEDDELGRRELLETHGAKGVDFTGANTDLGAKSQFAAIIESRRGIHHHCGRVHPINEFPRSLVI